MPAPKRAAAPPRQKSALRLPKPRTNSAHDKPALRKKPTAPRRRKTAAAKPAPLPVKQPPPPRAADPLARQTGARLAYYTPEFLAEAKRRVEQTLQSTNAIAHDFGMDHGPLWRLIRRYGWVRPEGALRRPRGLSPVMRLAAQADALVGAVPPPERGRACPGLDPGSDCEAVRVGVTPQAPTPTPTLPLAGGGSPAEPAAPPAPDNSTIDRLEAAVLKELARVETMRASLGSEPQRPVDAERTARTLSVLTETMAKLRRLRMAAQPQQDTSHDDYPADIDEFRREFARRLEAFIASRTGGGGAGGAGPAEGSDPV